MNNRVKICGITRPQDAELALELGADFLGIIVYPKSPRCVQGDRLRELCRIIPPEKRVFVDVASGTDELEPYLDLGFAAFQIHFDLSIGMASLAGWMGLCGKDALWLAPRIPPAEMYFPQIVMEFCDTVLIDAYSAGQYGGTGHVGDWQRFMDWSTLYQHKHWILAGGLSPSNLAAAMAQTTPWCFDVNSGVESAPGLKCPEKLRELFTLLRQG